jgi:ATP-dependent RNA helicase SUPV3L1/SUV3
MPVECLAIDEIQTAISFERGHVFTDRLLHARGLSETLLLGAATMTPVIRTLLPAAEIINRPRLSALTYAGSRKISRQPPRTAIVAFSAGQVYAIAELLRRERGGAAVVMGALSPRTRNAQVDLYQNGDVDFLVATDAIGMGLNLDVHHVAFADDTKFDGIQTRPLTPAEFAQIAGRAGRHLDNGTFGVTARAEPFEEELVAALESHDFEPVRQLQWRNSALDFASIESLRASLERTPDNRALTRVPVATDQQALDFLARNEAARYATGPDAVRLLWECCGLPDYRDISPAQHGEIVTRIFTDLRRNGKVAADWIAEQVGFCDNTSGDIDTLSNRIRQIRTWTFVANRRNWLEDPAHWREKTRDIEDRLSDALHERLTQRFVDRRTGVLIRHLRDRLMALPEINASGEVSLEGHLIGSIEGFRFTLARSDEGDAKGLNAAAAQVIAPEIRNRADRLAGAPNEEFILATDGLLRWKGEIVAQLAEGETLLSPRLIVLADESLNGVELQRVEERLSLWLRHHINTQLEPVMALAEPADLEGAARGLAFRLYEHLGILPRQLVAEEVKGLDQEVRGKLRKHGVKFGAYHIYLPAALKPAPRELAIILHALKHGGVRQPGVAELPHIVLSGRTSFLVDPEVATRLYEVAGFKVAGKRAVRVDILERLADIIRPLIAFDPKRATGAVPAGAAEGNGFRVTVEMTSLLGCSGEDFSSILASLGYRMRRVPKPATPVETVPTEATPASEAGAAAEPAPASPADEPSPTDLASEAAADVADLARLDGVSEDEIVAAERDLAEVETAAAPAEAAETPAVENAPEPPAEAAAESPTPVEATAPTEDATPAEGTAEASAPVESDGTAEPAAPVEAAAPAEPAEPAFDEIWFPGGRRPEHRGDNRNERRNYRPNRPPAAANGAAPAEAEAGAADARGRPNGRHRHDQPPGSRPERQPARPRVEAKGDGKDNDRGDRRPPRRDRDRDQKPFDKPRSFGPKSGGRPGGYDPDSPFAALAVLRDRKPE